MQAAELRALSAHEADSLPPLLRALWMDARGDWEGAHGIAQDDDSREAAQLHAYLHRKEGDTWNAGYWYRRAGVPVFAGSLEQEWESLAEAFRCPAYTVGRHG